MEHPNAGTDVPFQSKKISKLAAALAKAQAKIKPPEKNKTVVVKNNAGVFLYEFDYADYGAIVEAIRGPLTENEIAFTHLVERTPSGVQLVTKLIHSSGEELESIYPLPTPAADPKGFGGAVTYGKRYALSAITGCVADDDVDENPEQTTDFKDKKGSKKADEKPPGTGTIPGGKPPTATGQTTPGGITLPNTPPLNPDEFFVKGAKAILGKRIDEVPLEKLELFKADAEKHFSEAGVDPETSQTDVARSYRTVRAILKTQKPAMPTAFQQAPSGPITPKD